MPNNIIMADQKGGGITIDEMASGAKPTGDIVIKTQTIIESAFYRRSGITSVICDETTKTIGKNAFSYCRGLKKLVALGATSVGNCCAFAQYINTIVLPSVLSITQGFLQDGMKYGQNGVVDLGSSCASIAAGAFSGASKLKTLVLRRASVVTLASYLVFSYTPFANGGSGGTIYIPKSLYDHLGDGTADDYQAAANWSTVYGYGTITWAQIEGSIYETQYADGTPIPTGG